MIVLAMLSGLELLCRAVCKEDWRLGTWHSWLSVLPSHRTLCARHSQRIGRAINAICMWFSEE